MTCTNPEKRNDGGEEGREGFLFSLPFVFPFAFSSRSTFRAITRLKTLATQGSRASSVVVRYGFCSHIER